MKKKIFMFLFLFISLIFNIIDVSAEIDVNAAGGETSSSKGCSKGGICASTVGLAKDIPNEPIDGMRVILMNGDISLGSADLWFTADKQLFAGGSENIEEIFNKYHTGPKTNTHDGYYKLDGSSKEVYDYSKMLHAMSNNDDVESIDAILKAINPDYTIANTKEYYLVVEPIFVLKYTYTNDVYYVKGTVEEVINQLLDLTATKNDTAKAYAKYFAYKDTPNCKVLAGLKSSSSGSCQNWNVLTNIMGSIYLESPYGLFQDTNGVYVYEKAASYSTNIYGKGIIQIRDYAKNDLSCLSGNLFSNQIITNQNAQTVNCEIGLNLREQMTLQNKKVISGQLIKSDNPITEGTLTMKCSSYLGNIKYSDYVGDIYLGDKKLLLQNNYLNSINLNYNASSGMYEGSVTVGYLFPPVYLEYMSGKVVPEGCTNCKFVGYGLVTKFTQTGTEKLSFKVTFAGQTFETEEDDDCSYNASKQLVDVPGINDKLMLEFRTTSSNNPFSGKSGEGRKNSKIGKNWKSPVIREAVFELRNDSYNKLKSEPLYIIKLTSSDIVDIREYNLNHSYDYYDGSWENDIYRSKFLSDRNIVKNSNIEWLKNYKVPRFCGDINSDGFVDTTDMTELKFYLSGASEVADEWAADVDGNEKIETIDYNILKLSLVGSGNLSCRESDV